MELQNIFTAPIISINKLTPGYTDHASDIWLVKTTDEEVVVRASKVTEIDNSNFWWGCNKLFSIDPRNIFELEHLNDDLRKLSSIAVPKVLRKGILKGRKYIIVEKMEGETLNSFYNLNETTLEDLGEAIAKIHSKTFTYYGNPSGYIKNCISGFHDHLGITLKDIIDRFYFENIKIKNKLPEILMELKKLPHPESASYVLVDMDPTQFLIKDSNISALVDTEAYVIAPRELDFIGFEYIMNKPEMEAFLQGYRRVLDVPKLSPVRNVYRFLYRLLEVQGGVDIDNWLNHPWFVD